MSKDIINWKLFSFLHFFVPTYVDRERQILKFPILGDKNLQLKYTSHQTLVTTHTKK